MKKSLIYTKTGDSGTTSLIGGTRVRKDDIRFEAYGTVDELNAQLGLLYTYLTDDRDRNFVLHIQNTLFVVGSHLATDLSRTELRPASVLDVGEVETLEQEMDCIDDALPPLKDFVIPSGSRGATVCHVCRTVCRRAERNITALAKQIFVSAEILAYVNRLSDYLFVLSRKMNQDAKKDEIFWLKYCK